MKKLMQEQVFSFAPESCAAAQLLAFVLQVRQFDLQRARFSVSIPKTVFDAMTSEAFKEVFSDLLMEWDPSIEQRMTVRVVADSVFKLGPVLS